MALPALLLLAVLLLPAHGQPGQPDARPSTPAETTPADLEERARQLHEERRLAYLADTNSFERAWRFAAAAFDYAEFPVDDRLRARLAEEGIAISRHAVHLAPSRAEGHYYLGLNIGQLARTRGLSALRLVRDMEAALLKAHLAEESLDFAGPDRILGQLYLDAPGWPTSIGSRQKARQHLEAAVRLHPNHPANRLSLIEALVQWRQYQAATEQMRLLDASWGAARERLTGPSWEDDWISWEDQRATLRQKLSRARHPVPEPGE